MEHMILNMGSPESPIVQIDCNCHDCHEIKMCKADSEDYEQNFKLARDFYEYSTISSEQPKFCFESDKLLENKEEKQISEQQRCAVDHREGDVDHRKGGERRKRLAELLYFDDLDNSQKTTKKMVTISEMKKPILKYRYARVGWHPLLETIPELPSP
ncbi:hypothetical protein SUGI_0014840 [Cryptomeria japonica]|nr:hypothetical protein SUGI_0014840 [Cryptomeria japonica]